MLVGMTGMGGGSLMTPLLILVFGIQPVTAVGTDIFYGAVTKTAGGWRHLKHETVHRGIAFWLAVGSVPMAIAGVWLIEILQRNYGEDEVNKVVLGMVASALLVVGVATLIRALFLRDVIPERYAMHLYRRHIIAAVDHRRDHRLRDRPDLGGQRHADRDRPDRGLPPHPAARRRHRRLPRRRPAVGGGDRPLGRRQRRLRARRQHPRRLDPGRADRQPARGQGADRPAAQRPRVVLIASAITLITKEHVPKAILIPSLSVAALVIAGLFAFQIGLHRQRAASAARAPGAPRWLG